jgi:signal transduction histidine kinase
MAETGVPGPGLAGLIVADDIRRALGSVHDPVALLEGFFALAPFGLQIYSAAGQSLVVNQAFLDLFGSQPPPEYNVLRDEIAERAGFLHLIRRAFEGHVVRLPITWYDPRELRQVHIERGNRVAIDTTFFPLFGRDGAVTHVGALFKDVTAEQQAREEVEAERDLLSAIIEQSGDGILVVSDDKRVRIVNREAQRQGMRPPGERVDTHIDNAFDLNGTPVAYEDLPVSRALRGEAASATVSLRGADGVSRKVSARATPLRGKDGRLHGAVITTRDETARLEREEQAARTAHFREQFIGVLGHDLRTPLTAIAVGAGLILRNAELPPTITTAATRIASAADRMKRMIADLLDFTQARLGGGLPVSPRPADLGEIVQQVADEVSAGHPGREIAREVSGDLRGSFDPDRIAQLLGNLLENALAYSPPGGPVRVAARESGASLLLAVDNEGAELSEGDRARIFDPFRRGAFPQMQAQRGLGLGLFIVDQIARAHGGRVAVACASGRTRFEVTLPRQR